MLLAPLSVLYAKLMAATKKSLINSSLKDIDNIEIIKKTNYKINGESHKIMNEDYNYRILLKIVYLLIMKTFQKNEFWMIIFSFGL